MIDEIRDLYAYNGWATARIMAAADELTADQLSRDMGSSFPSILATLEHVVAAEWIWLERWLGRSPREAPAPVSPRNVAALRDRWSAIDAHRRSFLSASTSEALHYEVRYRTISGEEFASPLWQLLRHVVNHSSYHRGQVATMLRQLGVTPPATDLILYYRSIDS